MKFTDLFVRRPVLAIALNLVILLVGLQSLRLLCFQQYPRSDKAVVKVTTAYTGASAELIRSSITTPLEQALASADGIDYMESSSVQGTSKITLHLRLNFDINKAFTQIQAKVAQVRSDLPADAQAPIIDLQASDNEFALIYLSFYSQHLDNRQITDFLRRIIQPKLATLSGVQKADILGAQVFAMRIWLKPDRMGILHLTPNDVVKALKANNYPAALGATKGTMTTVNLVTNTRLRSVEEFRQLVITKRNGAMIRLKDIADVDLGAENYDQETRFDGQHATFVGIWALPTANPLAVAQAVRKAVPEIKKLLPPEIKCIIEYDSTDYIREAFQEIIKTLLEALLIVILVMFLFLGSIRSVLVPVVAIPVSLIGTALLMLLFGFSINLLTLLAVVLAVGLVVDDAIVVVENIARHIQRGLTPMDAALIGIRELVGPIIAMTLTLAAVYAPIGFQGGLTGVLFREFAFTLAAAVLVSGVVALTLAPMMSARLLHPTPRESGFFLFLNRRFIALKNKYTQLLAWALNYRPAIIVFWGFTLVLVFLLYHFSTKELAPHEDEGFIEGFIRTSANSTLDQTDLYARQLHKLCETIPEVEHTFEVISPTSGFFGISLKSWQQRKRSVDQVVTEFSQKSADIPGIEVVAMAPAPLPGADSFPIEFVIGATAEPQEILKFAQRLVDKAVESGLFLFADTDLKFDQPEYKIDFDRDKVAALGFDLENSGRDLGALLSGNYVNRFSNQGYTYKVIPQMKRVNRLNPDQLADTYLPTQSGALVKLATFADISHSVQPRELRRFQQLNSATIQGALRPGVSIQRGLAVLEGEARKILPPGYSIDYGGESRQFHKEGNQLLETMAFSLILIFLVLAAQFESFRDPFIILLGSAPLALVGALLIPFLEVTTLNIYTQIAMITLIGLITKNGILIVEFANQLQEQGLDKFQAAIEAASTRLRPILMTSISTLLGSLPLLMVQGPGANSRNSIGIVIIAGMGIGTLFTLFFVPALYTLFAKKAHRQPTLQKALPPTVEGAQPVYPHPEITAS